MTTPDSKFPPDQFAWRKQHAVFVPEANSLGALAVIRSLGRAGYKVYAASSSADALGLLSTYAERAEVCPPYKSNTYKQWLLEFLKVHSIEVIIPSENFYLAIRPYFSELAKFMPAPQDEATVYAALSKSDVHETLQREHADEHLPPGVLVTAGAAFPSDAELEKLGLPLFLKVDAVHGPANSGGEVVKARTIAEAQSALKDLLSRYRKVLIQGFVPGKGIGAFFILWNGEKLAEFMHRRIHEVPHTGGVSSFRESYFLESVRDDALAKMKALRWNGVAMLEYRYDEAAEKMYFVEINARFWGSLHLALYSGVDFPALLVDAFLGRPQAPVLTYPHGVRCRHTFPAETQYVMSCLKDSRLPLAKRLYPILEFVMLSFDNGVFTDMWFPKDANIYFVALKRTIKNWSNAVGRRARTSIF